MSEANITDVEKIFSVIAKRYDMLNRDSILELPFEENTFDCITIAFGLRNISDKSKALSEMYRVLKLGARLVCLELSKPNIPIVKKI